jgi:hypothetical protein
LLTRADTHPSELSAEVITRTGLQPASTLPRTALEGSVPAPATLMTDSVPSEAAIAPDSLVTYIVWAFAAIAIPTGPEPSGTNPTHPVEAHATRLARRVQMCVSNLRERPARTKRFATGLFAWPHPWLHLGRRLLHRRSARRAQFFALPAWTLSLPTAHLKPNLLQVRSTHPEWSSPRLLEGLHHAAIHSGKRVFD